MRVAIRVDASAAMGLGHLKRCMSLGKVLQSLGADVRFATRDLGIDTVSRLEREGLQAVRLPAPDHTPQFQPGSDPPHAAWAGVDAAHDADQTCDLLLAEARHWDWVIVDSYSFDARWHCIAARRSSARICVIEDLADRTLDCRLLVDHNASKDHRSKYAQWINEDARVLGGPRFALLDKCYETARLHEVRPEVRSIGIFMGGTDPWNASEAAVTACRRGAGFRGRIEIATTRANAHLPRLAAICNDDPETSLVIDAPDLADFFARHDLQVGAGGGAVWERCRIGAPTIALVLADNHRASLDAAQTFGAVCRADSLDEAKLGGVVADLMGDFAVRTRLSMRARELVDGRGATRVALAMLAPTVELRRAKPDDALPALAWRNAEPTRRHFRDSSALEPKAHVDWWNACIASPSRRLLVAHCGPLDVGVLRLDIEPGGRDAEISLYLDPELHGLGLGVAMLAAVQSWTRDHEPAISHLVAEVLPGNEASKAAFRAAGFLAHGARHWRWIVRP